MAPDVIINAPPPPSDAPDSVKLAASGIIPGRQLIAYLLLASRCGHCQRPETKAAVRSLRKRLSESTAGQFRVADIIGVAIDADIAEGLQYLTNIGLDSFDEVSVGNAWLNENLVRWVWRERLVEPAVPQVILVSRQMSAAARPFDVTYTADSTLAVLTGRKMLVEWVERGATISVAQELAARAESDREAAKRGSPNSAATAGGDVAADERRQRTPGTP